MPLLLAVLTIAGLLLALNGTGIWHWLSWITLGIPMVLMGWHIYKAKIL